MSVYLVPATVELSHLDGTRFRLLVVWTNGQRGKWDGPDTEVRPCHQTLLAAMSAQATVDVSRWPKLRIGSGFERDW